MWIVYKTTNLVNNKIYIGVHRTAKVDFDGYFGSGVALKRALKKYKKKNFIRETLFEFSEKLDAYVKEAEIVNESFICDEGNYNMCVGGLKPCKPFESGILLCRDKNGLIYRVTVTDGRYKSGELVHIGSHKGKIRLINIKSGKNLMVDINSALINDSEFKIWSEGMNRYIDPIDNKSYYLDMTNPIIKEKKLIPWTKGKVVVRNKQTGEIIQANSINWRDDANLESITLNTIAVKDSEGNFLQVSSTNPLYLSGQLVGVNKGKKGLAFHLNQDKINCPYCTKNVSKGNYARWHGAKCKSITHDHKVM